MNLIDVVRLCEIADFPKHFHNGSELKVTESHISSVPEAARREFLTFAQNMLAAQ